MSAEPIKTQISRSGVFEYFTQENQPIKELRPIGELEKTLDKFSGIPLLKQKVDACQLSSEIKKHLIGRTIDVEMDSTGNVFANLAIEDAGLLEEVRSGTRAIGCCYQLETDLVEGEFEGERYNGIQKELKPLYLFPKPLGELWPSK